MDTTAKSRAIQGISQKRPVRAVVFDYGNVLCLAQIDPREERWDFGCWHPHHPRPRSVSSFMTNLPMKFLFGARSCYLSRGGLKRAIGRNPGRTAGRNSTNPRTEGNDKEA